MQTTQPAAPGDPRYPFELRCCGRLFVVRRELSIAQRIEAHLGPCGTLAARLGDGAVTIAETVLVYSIALGGDSTAPERDEIERWVFAYGVPAAARQISWLVVSLTLGNENARHLHERLLASARAAKPDDDPLAGREGRGPFVPAGASTGRI